MKDFFPAFFRCCFVWFVLCWLTFLVDHLACWPCGLVVDLFRLTRLLFFCVFFPRLQFGNESCLLALARLRYGLQATVTSTGARSFCREFSYALCAAIFGLRSILLGPLGFGFGFRVLGFGFWFWVLGFGFGFLVLGFGLWLLGFGFGFWVWVCGFWVVGFWFWVLGLVFGFLVLGFGFVGFGFWVFGFGFWVLGLCLTI